MLLLLVLHVLLASCIFDLNRLSTGGVGAQPTAWGLEAAPRILASGTGTPGGKGQWSSIGP